ncbi:hypothetical protein CKO15_08830, partial [Halorhodospira abdelmalekii]|uniref:hypothetical protein n=1 Tax=Halorhodospira abdelmalekii TaxID=421629 RepID=UPI001908BD34
MKDVMKDGTGHEKERRLQCDSTWTLAVVSRRQAVKAWISLIAGGALVLGGGGFPLIGSADSRIEIAISQADRDHCASRMREYMEIVNEILWATLEEDMEGVAEAAILGVPRRY